jgi:hypothetical protein
MPLRRHKEGMEIKLHNCQYHMSQAGSWVGPRSSLDVVVKTKIPTTDKKLTLDHPISDGCAPK